MLQSEGCVNLSPDSVKKPCHVSHVSCGMYGAFASAFQEGILSSIDGPPLCAGEEEGRVQSVVSHMTSSVAISSPPFCADLWLSLV